jgi:hypothetical protein
VAIRPAQRCFTIRPKLSRAIVGAAVSAAGSSGARRGERLTIFAIGGSPRSELREA